MRISLQIGIRRYIRTVLRSRRRQALACCPACAATVRRRKRRSPLPPAWLGLLAVMAATVPIAALQGRDGARAQAAGPQPAPQAPPKPAPPPALPIEQRIRWRESVAHGSATAGWLQRGVQLPTQGPGFYTYNPYTQRFPNTPSRRYGTALLVRRLVTTGKWWQSRHPNGPRLGIGDLSRTDGGRLDNHVSHQNGLDADIRLPRRDGVEGRSNPANYDQAKTQELVNFLVSQGAEYVFYGPSLQVSGPAGRVMVWPNHDDHLHVRFNQPG